MPGAWRLAQLALLESLTEPIEHELADPGDLRVWVHESAPLVVMGRPNGDIAFGEVADALAAQIKPTTDPDDVHAAFAEAYPEPPLLWDASVRWLLSSLGSTLQLRGIKADSAILRVAIHRLREAALTHGALVEVALATRGEVASSYLDELERVLGELLADMGASDPAHLAGHITRFSLEGQHDTVVALLETASLPLPPRAGDVSRGFRAIDCPTAPVSPAPALPPAPRGAYASTIWRRSQWRNPLGQAVRRAVGRAA